MKQTRILVNSLLACVVVVAMVTNAMAESVKERVGKVVRIKGDFARYSTGNNVWQALKVGTLLTAGDTVQTGKDSCVEIILSDLDSAERQPATGGWFNKRPAFERHVVCVTKDSILAINKLTTVETGDTKVTETLFELRSGMIQGSVKSMADGSRFEVKVPNGTAGFRGTPYAIRADGVIAVKNWL